MSRKYETTTFKVCRCCEKWRCQCLIPRKRKSHPPFNSGIDFNKKIGLHPKFYAETLDSPAVGIYDPKITLNKPNAISWTKTLESKEFSETMGGRFLEKYAIQRNLMKTGRGPGTHEISQWPENIFNLPCKSVREDVGFGTVALFKPTNASTTPGPGYTRHHDPYYCLDQKRRKGLSCIPTFEFDGLKARFREKLKPWSLPCNMYDVKHPDSLETFLKKITGRRGPYDLFTGPRDGSTIKGYFAPPKLEDRGDSIKKLPGGVEELLKKSNYFKGRWTNCPRFTKKPVTRMMLSDIGLSYKDPNHPAPNHYEPKSPRKPRNALNYPFDSCIEFARPVTRTEIRPGPGRYKIKEKYRVKGNGWTWVFKSKVQRKAFIIPESYNTF